MRKPATNALAAEAPEPVMTEADFRRIAERIETACGIVLGEHKRQMVRSRLARRLKAVGDATFSAYLDRLDSAGGADELRQLVNALTTNLTSFFREPHHFDHLRDETLRPAAAGRLRIWSAGCSSGEEPYSIAAICKEAGRAGAGTRILATDIDTEMLDRARRAVYPEAALAEVDAERRARMTRRRPDGALEIRQDLRSIVSIRSLNLFSAWPMRGRFDAIFCRNVLIYFGSEAKAALVTRFARTLAPGGFLYLGHSEALLAAHPLLESAGRTVYRRRP